MRARGGGVQNPENFADVLYVWSLILEFEADGSEHSDSVLLLVAFLLEEHEIDEEHGANECRLHPHVEIHWEAVTREGNMNLL